MKRLLSFFLVCTIACSFFVYSQSYTHAADPCEGKDCITSDDFKISVGAITPGSTGLTAAAADGSTGSQAAVGNFLTKVLESLIIVFGVLAILIMTVGAGYMIIYHGQDEFLSKGKSIFVSGLIALAVALSAGVIVRLFAYLLYSAT